MTQIPIIYRDKHIIVLNKPGGLLCHPTGIYQGDTLIARLRQSFGDQARLVHRLDQNTSGAIVVALENKIIGHLYRQFEKRRVKKNIWRWFMEQ